MRRGFTLIELLIVVAIIAILAAIAVPNFLEAQVRSKVSRVKSDLRTVTTALESYYVDNNKYPPRGTYSRTATGITKHSGFILLLDPIWITTPISYITGDSVLRDPFQVQNYRPDTPKTSGTYDEGWFRYTASRQEPENSAATEGILNRRYGGWRLLGAGPDRFVFNFEFARPAAAAIQLIPYDATNGTISIGDVMRSQKESDVTLASTLLP